MINTDLLYVAEGRYLMMSSIFHALDQILVFKFGHRSYLHDRVTKVLHRNGFETETDSKGNTIVAFSSLAELGEFGGVNWADMVYKYEEEQTR